MLGEWLGALEASRLAELLRSSAWAYPAVNTLDIVGIALLLGAIVPLYLRLAGWRREKATLAALATVLLSVAIFGFILAALAGLLLFVSEARACAASPLFRARLVLIGAALGNAWLLRRVDWQSPAAASRRLALAGAASILLWLGTISLGRLIAYA